MASEHRCAWVHEFPHQADTAELETAAVLSLGMNRCGGGPLQNSIAGDGQLARQLCGNAVRTADVSSGPACDSHLPKNKVDFAQRIERFLARHLQGPAR
jgi:hypothetical protein